MNIIYKTWVLVTYWIFNGYIYYNLAILNSQNLIYYVQKHDENKTLIKFQFNLLLLLWAKSFFVKKIYYLSFLFANRSITRSLKSNNLWIISFSVDIIASVDNRSSSMVLFKSILILFKVDKSLPASTVIIGIVIINLSSVITSSNGSSKLWVF